jgi:hypothetical protein
MNLLTRGSAVVAAGALIFLLAACGGGTASTSSSSAPSTNTADSEVAIGVAAGATGSDDSSSGVALRSKSPLEWIADHLAFERVAYAAGWSCGSATWTGSGTASQTYLPPNCMITYGNGSSTTLTWTGGPWDLNFAGTPACTPTGNSGLVGSGCASGGNVTWKTNTPIVRSWTGPLGHAYAVTTDAGSGGLSGWTTSLAATETLVTCTGVNPCPAVNVSSGTRTFSIGSGTGATHITGTLDGATHWDHTVYTTTDLTVNGSGAHRVIVSGTIVVEHNLAHKVFTTTFNGPLNHEANCAFPISGSVTTTVQSSGSDNGKTETVTFSSTCGMATITNTDGSVETFELSLVL